MHGPTCVFWATLTPFSLKFTEGVGGNANGIRLAEISLYAAEQAGECTRGESTATITPNTRVYALPPSFPPSLPRTQVGVGAYWYFAPWGLLLVIYACACTCAWFSPC